MKLGRKHFLELLLMLAASCAAAITGAAGYPERPVQLVVPFPPGGAGDVLARILARQLETNLGQAVIVENKAGAGTIIGAQAVANARADGYTLLLSSNSTYTVNPAIHAKLPYDPAKDFEPVGMVATASLVLLSNPASQFGTVQQLVAAAKANPEKIFYGSFGNGTVVNFAGEMFNAAAGVKLTHVPYRGSSPAMTDLIGGQIPVTFDTVVAALPHLKTGKIRALAVTTARRSALLPDVPTMAESGYPNVEMSSWIALVAPKGLQPEVKARLEQALAATMASPEVLEKLKSTGFEPSYAPIKDWPGTVGKDIARLRLIAERAQIKAE